MRPAFLFLATLSLSLSTTTNAGDWPQLLGSNRDGYSPDETIRSTFDPEPEIAWKHKVGDGLAGPAVADGKVIIFHRVGDTATVDALDTKTGKPAWQFTYPTDYRDRFGFDPGPRATPTIKDGRVFTYGAEGMLHCIKLADGEKVWSVDTVKELGSEQGFFGRASAPIVHKDTLIIQLDGIFGLDVTTGEKKWKATEHEAGYASPTLSAIGGKTYSLHLTRTGFVCLDPEDGSVLIEKRFRATINASVNAATPLLIGDDKVFLTAAYDVGAALWSIDPAKKASTEIWARGDVIDAHYATPVPVDAHIFGFHGRQETGQELRCIDPLTGKVNWSQSLTTGCVIAAGKQLIVLTEKGELILAPADPKKFAPTARGQILGATTRAIPALADAKLYARDGKNLVCVDLSKD